MSHSHPTNILVDQFMLHFRMTNRSDRTVEKWTKDIHRFLEWAEERGITCVTEVTTEILAAYRRHLFHHRNRRTGQPIKFSTQSSYLISVTGWFRWLAKENHIPENITDSFELPKAERRLPQEVLNHDEMESLMNAPDIKTPLGLRDRAILETFYSTAIRVTELCNLQVYDLESERGVLKINLGKGGKDRVVPIGKRAMKWIAKYTTDIRPLFINDSSENALFVSFRGNQLGKEYLSGMVRKHLLHAGIHRKGSCHLIRHTAATQMLLNGADIRLIQELLGHAKLTTTQIYTHISINDLKRIHSQTHPAEQPPKKKDD